MKNTKTKMIIIIVSIFMIFAIAIVALVISVNSKRTVSKQEELWEYVFAGSTKNLFKSYFAGEDYNEFLKGKKYEETANITFEGNISGNEKLTDNLKNFEININRKVNNETNQEKGDATLNYLKNQMFKLDYIKDNNSFGVKSDEVIDRYLGIKNEKLNELLSKLDINTSLEKIQAIELNKIMPEEATIDSFIKDLKLGLTNQIDTSRFTKQTKRRTELDGQEIVSDSYTLELDDEDVYKVEKSIIEQIANDAVLIQEINNKLKLMSIDTQINKDNIINLLNSQQLDNFTHEQKMIATIYVANQKMVKADITINNNGNSQQLCFEVIEASNKLKLTLSNQDQTLEIAIEKNPEQIYIVNLKHSIIGSLTIKSKNAEGSLAEGKVVNAVEFDTKWKENNLKVRISDTINVIDNVETENLNENNCVFLNDMEKDTIQYLYSAIQERVKGLYNEKKTLIENGEIQGQTKPVSNEVIEHNKKFEIYEGEYAGVVVVEMLNKIIESNSSSEMLIDLETKLTQEDKTTLKGKEVTVEKVQPLANLLNAESMYQITIEKQPVTGAINKIKIVKSDLNQVQPEQRQVVIQNEQQ